MDEETKLMLDDCMKRIDKLTEWEYNFVNSILYNTKFTHRQLEKLDMIWNRVTGQH